MTSISQGAIEAAEKAINGWLPADGLAYPTEQMAQAALIAALPHLQRWQDMDSAPAGGEVMTYTAESLAAMPDRELDTLVAKVVFKADAAPILSSEFENAKALARTIALTTPPIYSTTYYGMGLVIKQMQKADFYFDIGGNKDRCIVEFYLEKSDGLTAVSETHNRSIPRAVCISAILAVQALNEPKP